MTTATIAEQSEPNAEKNPPDLRMVTAPLAIRDLVHEPLISICLIFSVVAVLAPILLLTSVKVGFIDSLRQQFIEDPSFREIKPRSADLRSIETIEAISDWDGVQYAVPTVMMNPREVAIRARGSEGIFRAAPRLLPSTQGDPLLRNLTGSPPEKNGVVLTFGLFEQTGLNLGDTLTVGVTRIVNDERQSVRFDVSVVGWIPTEESEVPAMLAAPEIEQQVEAYRAGIAVPERGWASIDAEPEPAFENILIVAERKLGATLETELRVRVGAKSVDQINRQDVEEFVGGKGLEIPPTSTALLLRPGAAFYTQKDIAEAAAVLSNTNVTISGISKPIPIELLGQSISLSAQPDGLTLSPQSSVGQKLASKGRGYLLNDRLVLPQKLHAEWVSAGEPSILEITHSYPQGANTNQITVPLRLVGFHDGEYAVVTGQLMGLLKRGYQIALDFDPANRRFIERNAGFRGFRIIGNSIDIIPDLERRLNEAGINVKAKSSQILKLQRLEQSLNLLVSVVASVALIGGLSILTASFFANVQRKRVDYATLRLIGMPKHEIGSIPIIQAVIVAAIGFFLSGIVYFFIAILLNGAVAEELGFDGKLSKLFLSHFIIAGIIVIGGSSLASLVAARAATQIDPATALRSR